MKDFNNVTRKEVARVFEALGANGFHNLATLAFPADVKYSNQTMGQDEAILNMLSREEWEAVLRGEKELFTKDAERLLADKNGRIIPVHVGVVEGVCDEETAYHVSYQKYPAKFNYGEIIGFYQRAFPANLKMKFMSATEFEKRAEEKRELLMRDRTISNLIKRAFPLPLPQLPIKDIATAVNKIFIPAAKIVYKTRFPNRNFEYYCADKDNIWVMHDSQKLFIEKMKFGPDVVWYFPNSMQGFSIAASLEAMKFLQQKQLALAGVIEPLLGIIGYANEMTCHNRTPGYLCSGVTTLPSRSGSMFVCEANDSGFKLFCTDEYFSKPTEARSPGIVFIG